jgi:putative oxidoreductase
MQITGIQNTAAPDVSGMNVPATVKTAVQAQALLVKSGTMLQSPLLLVMRLWWGWSFFLTGKGKLINHAGTTDFFQGLGIPLPGWNAWMAGGVECLGGLCLLVGVASRLTAIPLSVTMIVAYVTADNEALKSILSDPDQFTSASPFLFLLTAVLVLAFGPGAFSVDRLLARKFPPSAVHARG